YAGTQGFLDKVPVARVREWEAGFVRFLKSEQPDLLAAIEKQKALDDPLFERLKAAISTFNHQFGVEADKASGAPKPAADKSEPRAQAPAPKAEPKQEPPAAARAEPKAQAPAPKAEPKQEPPPAAMAEPKAQAAAPKAEPKQEPPAAEKAEPKAQAPAPEAEPKQEPPAAAEAEPKAQAPAPEAEPKQEPPAAAEAEPKAQAPIKAEKAEAATDDDTTGNRPSQLDQIRAVLADPPAGTQSKPRPAPKKPKDK
ncbi:MAG TPA: hypothetical protein VGU71_07605, partial [Candidatus Dormibacteraeota bacterium]|nr:hypothetical protein [Candidatus Dormibacteraeota bacterium]